MRGPGFEPGPSAWKAEVLAARPPTLEYSFDVGSKGSFLSVLEFDAFDDTIILRGNI